MALRYLSRAVNAQAALRLLLFPGPLMAPSSTSAPLKPLASRFSQVVGLGHNTDVADEAATKATTTTNKTRRTSTRKQQQVTEKETTEKTASKEMRKIDRSFAGKEQVIQGEIVGAAIYKTENNMEKTKIAGDEILEVANNDKPEKNTDGLSFMGEEQVTGEEIVQVDSDEEMSTESETDGSDDEGEEEELMADEEFEQVIAEVNELLAYTTSAAIYDRFSLDRELLKVRLSRKKPFVQAMYFYARDVLLEELESRRERDDGPGS